MTTDPIPSGTELDYVEITSNVNVTQLKTAPAVVIQGNPITLDGLTRIRVEFFSQVVEIPAGYYDFNLGLYENGAPVRLFVGRTHDGSGVLDVEGNGVCYITPTAGTHTYQIAAYRSPGSPSSPPAIIAAGDGVNSPFPPTFYRVTVA